MIRTKTKAAPLIATTIVGSLALNACSSSSEDGSSTNDAGVTHITVASQANPSGFTLWLADELGYYEDADLSIEIQYAESGAALLASGAAGDWQAGWLGTPPMLTGFDTWGLIPAGTMMFENKNIITFMDSQALDGSTPAELLASTPVGVVANSVSAQLLYACAETLGVDAANVETIPLDPPAIVNGMLNGDIDAAVTFSAVDWPLVQEPDRYVQVCDGDDAGVQLIDSYMVTPTFWDSNPDAAAALVNAFYLANEYILETPADDLVPLYMEYFDSIGVDYPEDVARYSLDVRRFVSLDDALLAMRNGEFADALGETADFLVDAGVNDHAADVDDMATQGLEVLEAAAAVRAEG